jgi:nitrite reductase (NO-forming)
VARALPTIEPVAAEGACCAACAAERPPEYAPARPALPVVQSGRTMITRNTDRRIAFGGVLAAAGLLGLAGLSAVGSSFGGTAWLPLHLAMAGAAGTAIAAILPFFTSALARVAPARPALRIAAVGSIAGGSLLAGIGMSGAGASLAATGGVAYLAGLLALVAAAFLPLRATLGFKLRLVHLAYAHALGMVAAGVILSTAMLAGWAPVASAWLALKPAHAWLNVFGFVTVVVAASLIHLAPTVAGARIRPRRSADVALVALVAGAPLVAVGFATGSDVVARAGAVIELVGAAALLAHGSAVQRDRGRWTSDPGWHRFAGLSLLAGPAWLLVAVAIAGGQVLWLGAVPAAWSVTSIAVPLVAGGIGQILVGAWTHLVPAMGPGDQAAHAVQRRWLGRVATTRWLAWNIGVAILTADALTGIGLPTVAAGALLGASLATSLALLALAVLLSSRRAPAAVGAATR